MNPIEKARLIQDIYLCLQKNRTPKQIIDILKEYSIEIDSKKEYTYNDVNDLIYNNASNKIILKIAKNLDINSPILIRQNSSKEDFLGTYDGYQIGSRISTETSKKIETKMDIKMVIKKVDDKIHVYSFYYDSDGKVSSKSKSEQVSYNVIEQGKHYELTYHYRNEGNGIWDGHNGTTLITIIKRENTFHISGFYYTDRKPQTRGEFKELKRISKKTQHPF